MKTNAKNLIRTLLFLAGIILVSNAAIAQRGPGQGPGRQGPPPIPDEKRTQELVDSMAVELKLNAKQKDEIYKLYVAHFEEVKAKREAHQAAMQAHRAEMQQLHDEFTEQVKAQLSEEQQSQYYIFREEYCPRYGKGRGQGKGYNR